MATLVVETTLETQHARSTAERLGYPFVDLTDYQENVALWNQVLYGARDALPLRPAPRRGRMFLVIAVANPELYEEIGRSRARRWAGPWRSRSALRHRSPPSSNGMKVRASFSRRPRSSSSSKEWATRNAAGEVVDTEAGESTSPIIRLVDSLILNAVERRASDIHIESKDLEVQMKYRIDGVLYEAMDPVDRSHQATIISRLKVMAELDVAEMRIPQDGRFKRDVRGRKIDFRVSIMPSIFGEDAVIRISGQTVPSRSVQGASARPSGFGPTGAETAQEIRVRALRDDSRNRSNG